MNTEHHVHVTLSDKLLDRLCLIALDEDIPLRWLVAGLVCDTIETFRVPEQCPSGHVSRSGLLRCNRSRLSTNAELLHSTVHAKRDGDGCFPRPKSAAAKNTLLKLAGRSAWRGHALPHDAA
jgi:hypothetical protein